MGEATVGVPATLCEAFQRTVAAHADRPALDTIDGPQITWGEHRRRSERLAAGLMQRGVKRGETVAAMMANRPEYFLIDMATLMAGGTPFAMYNTSPPEELAHILDDARPRVVFVDGELEAALRAGIERSGVDPEIVVVGPEGPDALGAFEAGCPEGVDVEPSWRAVGADDIAVMIYTSGTTGVPKGVELSHRNVIACWTMLVAAEPRLPGVERLISYLPIAHLADRVFGLHASLMTGARLTCVADRAQIGAALLYARPSAFLGVPRIWEKFKAALSAQLDGPPDEATAQRIRDGIGLSSETVLWTGSAPLDPEVLDFFDSIGLAILEGYGMTETAAVVSTNRVENRRHGTVGHPVPGCEVRLAEDGEILVRGDNIMARYRNLPEQTAEALDADGWLHTGDVGTFDEDGFLTLVDRKKELLITAGGKNLAPTQIENAIRSACHLLGPVVAIGDRRPYITALLTLDPIETQAWATANGIDEADIAELSAHPLLQARVAEAVAEANTHLARVAQVKRYLLLPEVWAPDSGVVTPTLKLKRKAIIEQYADRIDSLYEDSARPGDLVGGPT
jgi:long-subunit acyl-CoA synthetase (AMP-forming)